jgi:hypothetical protein
MDSFLKLRQQTNKAATDILFTDLQTAFTFLAVADTTSDETTRQRNWRNAQNAYYAVTRFSGRIVMTDMERSRLETQLVQLRQALEAVGFVFEGASRDRMDLR